MAIITRAGPSQSQELETPAMSPTKVTGTQVLGPSFTAFLGALLGSWIERKAGSQTGTPIWKASIAVVDLTCSMTAAPAMQTLRNLLWRLQGWLIYQL